VECNLRNERCENLLSVNSGRDGTYFDAATGANRVTLDLPELPLAGGQYFWNVRLWDGESGEGLIDSPFAYPMVIDDEGCQTGMVSVEHRWAFEAGSTVQPRPKCSVAADVGHMAKPFAVTAGPALTSAPGA
jgi:hypothetical protein